ncbi:MAG: leucine-rich repeat domain-containing protein, partial [Ureaplasma sp.]|nr:leucine-rich repeat domain-containing protein [Ureaplasma sp.]
MNTKNLNNIQVNTSDIVMSNFTFYTAPIVTPPKPTASPDSWFTWEGTKITGLSNTGKQKNDFVLPAKTTELGDRVFERNNNIRKFDMTLTNIRKIPYVCFGASMSLLEVQLPNSLEIIDHFAFSGCENLRTINNIPSKVKLIGKQAFFQTGLSSITLNNNLKTIDGSAFQWCKMLKTINLPNSLIELGSNAFSCSGLTSITIPNSISQINLQTFRECTNLKLVTIPESVAKISQSAFENCFNLTEISIPNAIEIESFAFKNCDLLSNISLPNSLEIIGQGVFQNCTSLRTITLPNSIITINENAFSILENNTYKPLPNLKIYVSSERVKQLVINSGFNLTNN